jgi:hypothetical protein
MTEVKINVDFNKKKRHSVLHEVRVKEATLKKES